MCSVPAFWGAAATGEAWEEGCMEREAQLFLIELSPPLTWAQCSMGKSDQSIRRAAQPTMEL